MCACFAMCHLPGKLSVSCLRSLGLQLSNSLCQQPPINSVNMCSQFSSALLSTRTLVYFAAQRHYFGGTLLQGCRKITCCYTAAMSRETTAALISRNTGWRRVHFSAGPALAGSQFGLGQTRESDRQQKHEASEAGWAVRLANENGYLSWCRNTYLTTVVAIAMLGEGHTVMSQYAAEGAFLVAGLNLSWGTYQFIYNIMRLRKQIGMSVFGALLQVSLATFHLLLWFMLCILYIGYPDETDVDAIKVQLEEEARKGRI